MNTITINSVDIKMCGDFIRVKGWVYFTHYDERYILQFIKHNNILPKGCKVIYESDYDGYSNDIYICIDVPYDRSITLGELEDTLLGLEVNIPDKYEEAHIEEIVENYPH